MGIFEDIGSRETTNEARLLKPESKPELESQPQCEDCHSTWLWIDAYGNRHCFNCQPPPSPSFIRETIGVEREANSRSETNSPTSKNPQPEFDDSKLLRETVEKFSPDELKFYELQLAARRDANEPIAGLKWRAVVDVRIEFDHWPKISPDDECKSKSKNYYFPRS